ncbi:hypothetical protein D9615_007194 [Tricholomella constricta]|uniref:Extracellular serine-rich protein n=1 Tax=Tricholomella constricta TaxID=117010 RepID=A0A8H5M2Q9_9AGAR|nr:hypothetical protein D9615_007194 [Tricholomella constricta]
MQVHVGAEGSFYNPATISAALNDTINFIFVGPAHSVVQAAWSNPCVPLPGGFDSGVVKRANDSVPPPVWTLKITSVSDGLWFYCGNTIPVLHCAAGMVGAINPPSIPLYQEYVAAAKRVSVPPPSPSLALPGQGAFATNSAIPSAPPATVTTTIIVPAFITSAPTSSTNDLPLPTTTSVTATASSDHNEARSNKGATIGGSVAGGTIFLVLLALFAFILLRRRHNRPDRPDSKDFFRYQAQTPQFNTHGDRDMFVSAKPVPSATSTPERARRTALPPSTVSSPASVPSALVPQRASPAVNPMNLSRTSIATAQGAGSTPTNSPGAHPMRMHPPAAQTALHFPAPPPLAAAAAAAACPASPPLADKKLPLTAGTLPPVAAVSTMPLAGDVDGGVQSPNIHALAREVAAVLMQSPQPVRARPPTAGAHASSSSVGSLSRAESPAPPRYTRASVMG